MATWLYVRALQLAATTHAFFVIAVAQEAFLVKNTKSSERCVAWCSIIDTAPRMGVMRNLELGLLHFLATQCPFVIGTETCCALCTKGQCHHVNASDHHFTIALIATPTTSPNAHVFEKTDRCLFAFLQHGAESTAACKACLIILVHKMQKCDRAQKFKRACFTRCLTQSRDMLLALFTNKRNGAMNELHRQIDKFAHAHPVRHSLRMGGLDQKVRFVHTDLPTFLTTLTKEPNAWATTLMCAQAPRASSRVILREDAPQLRTQKASSLFGFLACSAFCSQPATRHPPRFLLVHSCVYVQYSRKTSTSKQC